jgi:hypothetical protein
MAGHMAGLVMMISVGLCLFLALTGSGETLAEQIPFVIALVVMIFVVWAFITLNSTAYIGANSYYYR